MSPITRTSILALALTAVSQAAPPAERPSHPHLSRGEDAGQWVQARRSANARAYGLRRQALAAAADTDRGKEREGSYRVGKGGGKTTIDYTVLEASDDLHSLKLVDKKAGVTVVFTLRDDEGTHLVTVNGAALEVGFNPDGTVSVGGTVKDSVAEAAWAVVHHPTAAPLNAPLGAAMVELMGALAEQAPPSRGNTPSDPPGVIITEVGCNLSSGC